jgi:FdhD protein
MRDIAYPGCRPRGFVQLSEQVGLVMPYRPQLTNAPRPSTFTIQAVNETGVTEPTAIAGEHPLTLYVDKREIVTLMTLGAAPEALAIGYLRNQRLARSIEEIVSVQVDWETDAVAVVTRNGIADLDGRMEKRTVTTGCGQGTVFGELMEEIDQTRLGEDVFLTEDTLFGLLDSVRRRDTIYKQAGAVHGCALARGAEILTFVEDIGRHNAVDAIAGWMWLEGVEGRDKIFYTTGRLTSEMVIKAAQMGIPFLVSRSGLTQMGYEIAVKVGITMIGRATGKHYLLFTGHERFRRSPSHGMETAGHEAAAPPEVASGL